MAGTALLGAWFGSVLWSLRAVGTELATIIFFVYLSLIFSINTARQCTPNFALSRFTALFHIYWSLPKQWQAITNIYTQARRYVNTQIK